MNIVCIYFTFTHQTFLSVPASLSAILCFVLAILLCTLLCTAAATPDWVVIRVLPPADRQCVCVQWLMCRPQSSVSALRIMKAVHVDRMPWWQDFNLVFTKHIITCPVAWMCSLCLLSKFLSGFHLVIKAWKLVWPVIDRTIPMSYITNQLISDSVLYVSYYCTGVQWQVAGISLERNTH